jgi:hypothetical protein|tara:strand:+ start:2150 stop:2809 length:660 start_codon:yes stop_codon:yes gene_type:complete
MPKRPKFKDNAPYKIIKGAINKELASFIYRYFQNKRNVTRFFFDTRWISPYAEEWGVWTDEQIPNTYSHYADLVMETLLEGLKEKVEKETGLKLNETYSYARIYKKGDILKRHKDRYSCEVSTTLHLGGDSKWPLYVDPTGKTGQAGVPVEMEPGDMVIYQGCELEHWREAYTGENYCQVFLHYNNIKNKEAKANKYDSRPLLGLPAWFKNFQLPSKKK